MNPYLPANHQNIDDIPLKFLDHECPYRPFPCECDDEVNEDEEYERGLSFD